jgi:SAM-dependent methyltransferase
VKYGYEYYAGKESSYGIFGGYTSILRRFCRFLKCKKTMSILKSYKVEGRLLDMGCAHGFWVDFSRRNGFDSSGCDISEYAISIARDRFPHIDFLQADIESPLDFLGSQFDVVTAFDVFEHCENLDSVLSEVKRLLNDKGILLISVPDTDLHPKEKDRDRTHVWHLNFDDWIRVFEKNDFIIVGSWVFPSWLKNLRSTWCVRFLLLKVLIHPPQPLKM